MSKIDYRIQQCKIGKFSDLRTHVISLSTPKGKTVGVKQGVWKSSNGTTTDLAYIFILRDINSIDEEIRHFVLRENSERLMEYCDSIIYLDTFSYMYSGHEETQFAHLFELINYIPF